LADSITLFLASFRKKGTCPATDTGFSLRILAIVAVGSYYGLIGGTHGRVHIMTVYPLGNKLLKKNKSKRCALNFFGRYFIVLLRSAARHNQ